MERLFERFADIHYYDSGELWRKCVRGREWYYPILRNELRGIVGILLKDLRYRNAELYGNDGGSEWRGSVSRFTAGL